MAKLNRDKIETQVLAKIERAKQHKLLQISPRDKERLQRFHADKEFYAAKYQNLKYDFADTSVMSAVERMTAEVMERIFGSSDIGSVKGRKAENDNNAEIMQEYCNWQIEYPNVGYQKFYWWVKESLYQLYSVVMVTQKREYEEKEEVVPVPLGQEQAFMDAAKANNVDIVDAGTPGQDAKGQPVTNVTIKYMKLTHNYPLIENVPTEELIWTPGSKTFHDCELVGRRKAVTIDYLVRNIKTKQKDGTYTGMYDKAAVMQLAANGSSTTQATDNINMDTTRQGYYDDTSYDIDDPNRKVWITECFVKADINGDKMLEDCIVTVAEEGNVFIRYEENEDGFPFCMISPVFDPFRVVPYTSGMDALGQWQDLLTAIIRLTVENLAINNNPQMLCSTAAFSDFNQVLDGEQFIDVNGSTQDAMQPVAQIPLASYTLNLIEIVKGWGEEASMVSRISQGTDPDTATKTFGGMKLLANMGSKAMGLILRNMSETGMKSLFMRMIFLNQKYSDDEQVVRLTGKDMVVNKDNLSGEFNYIVNAGLGAGVRQEDVQNMQGVVASMPTLIAAGLADKKNAYNAQKKMLELIGIKNTDDYIKEPMQEQPPVQPVSESLRIDFATLPVSVKIQILAKSGIQATPQDFEQTIQTDLAVNQTKEEQKAIHAAGKDILVHHLNPPHVTRADIQTLAGGQNGQVGTAQPSPTGAGIPPGYSERNQGPPNPFSG